MNNLQQVADVIQKYLKLFVWASVPQDRTRLTCLPTELSSNSFHAVLILSFGPANCQCYKTTLTVVVYKIKAY